MPNHRSDHPIIFNEKHIGQSLLVRYVGENFAYVLIFVIFWESCSLINKKCFIAYLDHDFLVWVFWWEAVVFLGESFPLGLLAMTASTWASVLSSASTVTELTRLPSSSRRVFTMTNQTTDTWELDQSVTTSGLLR